ncbi:MAG TPA: aspartate aminotransferase family protein [Polyangiaceae bacterium]|nr:aspartate aminotransferase family protein [Polyangiaceae bacterium]
MRADESLVLQLQPELRTPVPGPASRTWSVRAAHVAAPMGPRLPPGTTPHTLVLSRGSGVNLWDVDGNRLVDLAAGFGSLLLGHGHPAVRRATDVQGDRLWQAMGDLFPADAKVGLLERLCELLPGTNAKGILGQSGADAVSAALKTALLVTGRPGVIALGGAYHGLSYGPLAVCGLRASYREPFSEQLNAHVEWVPYPSTPETAEACVEQVRRLLSGGGFGALIFEPVLGRGGVQPMLPEAAQALRAATSEHGALLIADEIWTGLGRSGQWLYSRELGLAPDLICLGKGLGGGLPISACLGPADLMNAWSRSQEVVHTSTFSGAPLACATALATLDVLGRGGLIDRARSIGDWWREQLTQKLSPLGVRVRGRGMMIGLDVGDKAGAASRVMFALLGKGYLTSTGGGARETLVLTPPLIAERAVLEPFADVLISVLSRPVQ